MTRRTTKLGDVHKVRRFGGFVEVVESKSCGGVPMPTHYFVGLIRRPRILKRFKNREQAIRFARKLAER